MSNKTAGVPRRTFLKSTSSVAALVAAPHVVPASVLAGPGRLGANERITFGHIGVGGMGGYHLRDMVNRMKQGEAHIAAVCDLWQFRAVMG